MIPDDHKQILENLARAYVDELFKDFQDPNNRVSKHQLENLWAICGMVLK